MCERAEILSKRHLWPCKSASYWKRRHPRSVHKHGENQHLLQHYRTQRASRNVQQTHSPRTFQGEVQSNSVAASHLSNGMSREALPEHILTLWTIAWIPRYHRGTFEVAKRILETIQLQTTRIATTRTTSLNWLGLCAKCARTRKICFRPRQFCNETEGAGGGGSSHWF